MGPNDVLARTTHSGLCTTDVHAKEKGCGLGHEGVGFVEKIGDGVTNLQVGQRVGWGWLHSVGTYAKLLVMGDLFSNLDPVMWPLQDMCIWLSTILR